MTGPWSARCTARRRRSIRGLTPRSGTCRRTPSGFAWRGDSWRRGGALGGRSGEKGAVVRAAQQLTADGGEDAVGVVVADVERQVAQDPFEGAGPDQAPGPAGPHRVLDRRQGPPLD